MCFDFLYNLISNNFHSQKTWARYDCKHIFVFMLSSRYSCQILMKLEFTRGIFEKKKFHENPSSGRRVVQCGRRDVQADMNKLADKQTKIS